MKYALGVLTFGLITLYGYVEAQTSAFEVFLPLYRELTDASLRRLGSTSESSENLKLARQLRKLQPKLDDNVPFPCVTNGSRSSNRPVSVHSLRPGDIDIIGALGDSLTAGNGILATITEHIAIQNRGISPVVGGYLTWRQFLTLPNILKEFNPHLYGYSLNDTYTLRRNNGSQFNLADAFATSGDTPFMTKELIRRMKDDPLVDIKHDWKMITIMIGSNDFCEHMCYFKNPEDILENHRKDLTNVLRLLRDNLPRTIVNLIPNPHLRLIRDVTLSNRPMVCYFTHNFLCPCLFGLQFAKQQKRFDVIMTKWRELEQEVAIQAEFDRNDFTVVVQPFMLNYAFPTTKEGLTDYSALSEDCFHISQKEAAKAALSLWNNLLQPVGKKSRAPFELYSFKCPTAEHPYIFTRRNSV